MGLFSKRAATVPGAGNPIGNPRGWLHTATDGRDVLLNSPDGWEVDAPWLWWTGPAGSDGTGGPFGHPLTNDDPTGASSMAAVSRCTSLICDTIAGLPWYVRRGDYERLPLPAWLADPQATRIDSRVVDPATVREVRLTNVEFWAQWINAALWFGDGYVYAPVRDAAGAPSPPLWQLHPDKVTIAGDAYWVGDYLLEPGSVIHLRGLLPYHDGHGRGVFGAHGAELALAGLVRSYAAGVFTSGVPAGYLQSTQPSMTPDQAEQLKARWLAAHGGSKRSIAVLNATTSFTPIALSPVDAQLAAAREWSLRDIAMAFGLPAYMLGIPGDSSTYANIESRMTELVRFSLMRWIRPLEEVLGAQLPAGTAVRVNVDGLQRADASTRSKFYADGISAGWLTVNEVRNLEDLPPLPAEEAVQ